MKNFLLLLLLFCGSGLAANATANPASLYHKLCEVNNYWHQHPNAVPAGLLPVSDERDMIKLHLQLAEKHLRQTNVQHLSARQQQARIANLNNLRDYWQSGAFPINTTHAYRLPIFIDPFDNFCAVGYLIKASGNEELSRHISRTANFAYLADMSYPELSTWATNSGLTLDELAWIQPGYPPANTTSAMGGGTNGTVHTMTTDTYGNIYAAGSFSEADGNAGANNVAMWVSGIAGFSWVQMAAGLNGPVFDLEFYNGDLYAAGHDLLPTGALHSIAKWDGSAWGTTAPVAGFVYAMTVFNGELYVAGQQLTNQTYNALLYKYNGYVWTDLNLPITGAIHALSVHDNKLIIGGEFTSATAPASPNILAYDGSSLSGLGNGVPAKVRAIASKGSILFAGGDYQNIHGKRFGLARFDGSVWKNLTAGLNPDFGTDTAACFVSAIVPQNNSLLIAGNFITSPGGIGNFGKNLSVYQEYYYGTELYYGYNGLAMLNQPVHAMVTTPADSRLYIGGAFTENLGSALSSVGYLALGPTSAPGKTETKNLAVYPNPVNSQARIAADAGGSEALTFEVFNLLGQRVQQWQQSKAADGNYTLDRAQLGSGTYVLQVTQSGKTVGTHKFMVE